MDEREQRDAEINAALAGIESLINPAKSSIITDDASNDSIDELVELIGNADVKVKKNIHINDRVDFAAQIEEIESKGKSYYYLKVQKSREKYSYR